MIAFPRDQLTNAGINEIARQRGFSSLVHVEKWIMDFEVYRSMSKFLPNSAIKGGMAVPFYLAESVPGRLSVDIDIVTGLGEDDAKKSMDKVFSDMGGTFTSVKPHKPSNPKKALPLLTYYCAYSSITSAAATEIKIDLFYGGAQGATTQKFLSPRNIVGVNVDFDVEAYDDYSLIGDKLTALAFNTVGVDATSPHVPKHIHDIASLLRSWRELRADKGSISATKTIRALEMASETEIEYMPKIKLTPNDVYADLARFDGPLLQTSPELVLGKSYSGRFHTFAIGMLARNQQKPRRHVTDILMVSIFAKAITNACMGKMGKAEANRAIHDMLDELATIRDLGPVESSAMAKKLRTEFKKDTAHYDAIKTLPPEQVYLYKLLHSMTSP